MFSLLLGFLPKGIYFENMPIVSQALYHIKNSGVRGLSQIELAIKMGLNKKFIRGLTKRLSGEKHCQFYIENDGRRRSRRLINCYNMLLFTCPQLHTSENSLRELVVHKSQTQY